MVQRFVLSDLIPEHTWLNPSTSYFYFTDGEHLLTNYMMNIEKKRGDWLPFMEAICKQ